MTRPPLPPFDAASAAAKVQAAEDAWNTRDPEKVAAAYSEDSVWRNRDQFVTGRAEIAAFLARQVGPRAGLRAAQGPLGIRGQPHRGAVPVREPRRRRPVVALYGNELWEFDDEGYMRRREASINDVAIDETERRIPARAPRGPRWSGAAAAVAPAQTACVRNGDPDGGGADHRARRQAGARVDAQGVALAGELAVDGSRATARCGCGRRRGRARGTSRPSTFGRRPRPR